MKNESRLSLSTYAVYVAFCYWGLILGVAWSEVECYKELRKKSDELGSVESPNPFHCWTLVLGAAWGEAERYEKLRERIDGLNCVEAPSPFDIEKPGTPQEVIVFRSSRHAARSPNFALLALPGIAVLASVLATVRYMRPTMARGFVVLCIFVVTCWLVSTIDRGARGLGWFPSNTVLLAQFLFGALFWFLDSYLYCMDFWHTLEVARHNQKQYELLYDYAKFVWKVIAGLTVAVCFTMTWNIVSVIRTDYREAGIDGTMTATILWLMFCGGLGFLGWGGSEAGRRLWEVVRTPPLSPNADDPNRSG